MRETTVSLTDQDRVAASRTGLMSSLFPRFDEAVSPEFYRMSGRLRAMTNLLFIVANLVMAPQIDALGFDAHVHWRTLFVFLSIHVLDLSLGLALWRGRMTARSMRRVTYASVVLETCATVLASWVYGSVNSYFIGVELVFILIYRLAFDVRTGTLAFVLILVGQWAVVGLELARVIPA